MNNISPIDNTETQHFRHTYTSMHRNSHAHTHTNTNKNKQGSFSPLSFLLKLADVCADIFRTPPLGSMRQGVVTVMLVAADGQQIVP